jgi:phosphoribosylformylglycinamidine synthase
MRAGIVVFPGTNRERDMAIALTKTTGHAPHMIWHAETTLPPLDLVVLPGGFSHGDYLRCGAMAAHSPIMGAIRHHATRGGLVLGVCNGFQILVEAGLLPGVLLRNASLRFLSMDRRYPLHLPLPARPGLSRPHGPRRRQLLRR